MSLEHWSRFRCDECGRAEDTVSKDAQMPRHPDGWRSVTLQSAVGYQATMYAHMMFCSECAAAGVTFVFDEAGAICPKTHVTLP